MGITYTTEYAERQRRVSDAFGMRHLMTRTQRRDMDAYYDAQQHRCGRLDAWNRHNGGSGDGIEPNSVTHSAAWVEGYCSIINALSARTARRYRAARRELDEAESALSAIRYSYHARPGSVTYAQLDAAYERKYAAMEALHRYMRDGMYEPFRIARLPDVSRR